MNLQPEMAYSVVNKNSKRVKCQDFLPLQSGLILEPDQLLK